MHPLLKNAPPTPLLPPPLTLKNMLSSFLDAMATPDSASVFVEELHKRWFDNVKEYLDKKRERVDNTEKAKKKMKC